MPHDHAALDVLDSDKVDIRIVFTADIVDPTLIEAWVIAQIQLFYWTIGDQDKMMFQAEDWLVKWQGGMYFPTADVRDNYAPARDVIDNDVIDADDLYHMLSDSPSKLIIIKNIKTGRQVTIRRLY